MFKGGFWVQADAGRADLCAKLAAKRRENAESILAGDTREL